MRSVNKVIVLGHLSIDAETNFTPRGVAVTKLSKATSRRWKDSQSNEWKEETDWHNIVLWKSESLANYLTKGKQVYVEGRLQTRSYGSFLQVLRITVAVLSVDRAAMSVGDACDTPSISDYVETSGGPAQHPSHNEALVLPCGHLCPPHVARLKTEVQSRSRPMPDGEAVSIRPTPLS